MSGSTTRWQRLGRGARATTKVLFLLLALYMVGGFVATRMVQDPVDYSLGGAAVAAPVLPTAAPGRTLVRGAISVHTGRSHDAEGTLEEVAEAAAAAGLDFVILGDHVGDWAEGGAGLLDPTRLQGVLLVPGLELPVKDAGRVLAVGMDTLPREWLGSVEELVAEVDEGDGFLSIVHPRSPRGRERWDGLGRPGIDAWESFDVSEMARLRQDELWVGYRIAAILASMATGRGHESIAHFWKEGTETQALLAYDSVRASTPTALTGGLNHHPKARILGHLVPAYAPFFRTVVNHVRLREPLADDPFQARAQLLAALRTGRLFVTLGDGGDVPDFDVWADDGGATTTMGERGVWTGSGVLGIRVPASTGRVAVRILRDGAEAAWLDARGGDALGWTIPGPGSYRVELFEPGWKVGGLRLGFRPWIVSNPVELRGGPSATEGGVEVGVGGEVSPLDGESVGDPRTDEG